jgi:hypothetical protein
MIKKLHDKNASSGWNKLSPLNIIRYVSLTLGAAILIFVLIFLFSPDPFINSFVKNRITKAFTKTYPSYTIQLGHIHYSVWKNRLECDSIKLITNDSAFSYSIASLSVSGISWMKILLKGDYSSNILSNSVINAQSIELYNPQNKNKICFGKLHISVSDSELVADSIKYSTLIDDERFFAKSKFRQTIYRFDIPQIKIIGLDCRSLLSGNGYIAGNIKIFDLFADILVNMDKPYDINSPNF